MSIFYDIAARTVLNDCNDYLINKFQKFQKSLLQLCFYASGKDMVCYTINAPFSLKYQLTTINSFVKLFKHSSELFFI